jgi:tellurium resistance protein TerD
MAQMQRGANVALTREVPGLRTAVLGVHWDAGGEPVLADNLVFAMLLCDRGNRVLSDEHVVFFNQLSSPDLSVTQLEQVLGSDQEQIEVLLDKVPPEVERLVAVLYVNAGPHQQRALGRLRHCVLRVLNGDGNSELVRSEELAAGLSSELALGLGELYRYTDGWRFKVLGAAYASVEAMFADYGVVL